MPRPAQRVTNKAILFRWLEEMLMITKPHALISTTRPGPLSRRDIADVLRAIRGDPDYQGQTIVIHDERGHPVWLRGGEALTGWRN